jgi:tetratricopeptide (TPR) repeat protein
LKDPANLDAQTGLALIELKQNHLHEAAEAVRPILLKAPNSTDALLIAGIVAWRQTRFADAEKIFLKGVEIDDHRADFHAFLGRIAEAERRPQDALRQYERALLLDPHDSDIADRRDHLRDPQ